MEKETMEGTKKKLKGDPDMMVMELDPDILLLEIFPLLPFITAAQCRCVCKYWRTLLDDDFLMNIHAKSVLKLHGYDHHQPAHCTSSSSTIVSFISFSKNKTSLFGFYDDNLCSYKEYSFKDSSSNLEGTTMINSCNGLICLKTNNYSNPNAIYNPVTTEFLKSRPIAIYNPVTTKFLKLPWDDHYKNGGFGYDPSNEKYKILRTKSEEGSTSSYCRHQIYTLGTNGRWEDIKKPPFDYDVPGVHVNGALYWITGTGGNLIMSFDLADEEFRILTMLPPRNSMKPEPHYKLVESQGCLVLFVDQYSSPDDRHIELWVLEKEDMGSDRGFRYIWSNLMGISTVGRRIYGVFEFLALTQSGKVLFWEEGVLTCFDPKTERFASISDVPASSGRKRSEYVIVPHTNSLVSFNA